MFVLKSIGGLAAALFTLAVHAAPVLPSLTGAGWTQDRYDPASWSNVGTYQGRNNVLGIGIDSTTNATARPIGQQGTFYNTQGRQIGIMGVAGDSIAADLFLDSSWLASTAGFVRTDLWGRSNAPTETGVTYPIIGFTNFGGAARLRVFDSDTGGWVNLATDLSGLFGTWVSLEIEALANGYEYSVNGSVVYTDITLGSAGNGFNTGFLQAYNFNDPLLQISNNAAYTARWSDSVRNQVPVPGTLALAGLALTMLGAASRRRKLAA